MDRRSDARFPRKWMVPLTSLLVYILLVQVAGRPGAARSEPVATGQTVRLQKSFAIQAPVQRVFGLLSDLEQIPHYTNVERVVDLGGGRLRWFFAGGPGWEPYTEDVFVQIVPNRRITWRSVPESFVRYEGVALFETEPGGGTSVRIRMSYEPPGGLFGHAFACLVGLDPKTQLDDNVRRLKAILEDPTPAEVERLAWGVHAQ